MAAVPNERVVADRSRALRPLMGLTLGALAMLPYLVWDLPFGTYTSLAEVRDGLLESAALSLAVGGAVGLVVRRLAGDFARTFALLFAPALFGAGTLAPRIQAAVAEALVTPSWLGPAVPIALALIAVTAFARLLRGWPFPLLLAVGLHAALLRVPEGDLMVPRIIGLTVFSATLLALLRLHAALVRPTSAVRGGMLADLAVLGLVGALGGSACFARASIAPMTASDDDGGLRAVLMRGLNDLTDLDGDGFGVLAGMRDCDPLDAMVNPAQHEWADNDRDDNCIGGEPGQAARGWLRQRMAYAPKPPSLSSDLIVVTVDGLGLDDLEAPSWPELRALVARGVSFERAYATALLPGPVIAGALTGRLAPALPELRPMVRDPYPVAAPPTLLSSLRDHGFDVGVAGQLPFARLAEDARVVDTVTAGHADEIGARALTVFRRLDATRPRALYVRLGRDPSTDRALGALHRALGDGATWLVVATPRLAASGETSFDALRVPLVMLSPGLKPRRVQAVTSYLTITPTLLAMVAPDEAPEGLGPYLCLTSASCLDGDAPIAIEQPTRHLHAVVRGTTHIVRDVHGDRTFALELGTSRPRRRAPSAGEHALLEAWEEHALTDEPGRFWPY